jgi:DNA mismatch repair protein MutL
MSVIHILPEAVANKIAAGEVVERPSSIVKELVENSLDAGATRVEVYVEAGGKRLIRVEDDGCGMVHDDALLAFERHATSKIKTADDLFVISTLGFRGEALPSIASVSRLVLETRSAAEPSGTRVEIHGGKMRDVKEVARPAGTSLEVRDLFFNTPARRKFLKSESTELGHIATLVTHYALAHHESSFRLASLTNEILNVTPVRTARERLYQLLGGQTLEQLVDVGPVERPILAAGPPLPEEVDEVASAPPRLKISGFVSRPEIQKLNRNSVYFFVNRRLIRDRLILHAITEAYRNILPSGMFPVALLFLELPASEVDVNVHPSKVEVRFRHSSFVHDCVREAVRQALSAARPVPAFPGRRAPVPAEITSEGAEIAEKLSEEAPAFGGGGSMARPAAPQNVARRDFSQPAPPSRAGFQLLPPRPRPQNETLPLETVLSIYKPAENCGPPVEISPGGDEATVLPSAGELPTNLVPLGQVRESFIVATNPKGLWIIDQHVAHERILFEQQLRLRQERRIAGQRLLLPVVVQLKAEQQAVFQEIAGELSANGFEAEPFGQRTVAIKVIPAEIKPDDAERLLVEILDHVGGEAWALTLAELRAKIAASVACHAAIKVNMALDRAKMDWLLQELAKTENPMTCPHGRPVVLKYGLEEIQRAFKRI